MLHHSALPIRTTRRLLIGAGLFLFFAGAGISSAATLSLSPTGGGFLSGQTITTKVYVSSPDNLSINAISGVLTFPADLLTVTSVNKTGSVVNLWVQEPSFSNAAGTISLEGVVLNPGFTGTGGLVLTVHFTAKKAGVANVAFASGSVLANDGSGSNVLNGLSGSSYTIGTSSAGESTSASPVTGTPLAPQIVSPTNPNPDRWYSSRNPKFVWEVPSDVTAVRLLYNRSPLTTPTVVYEPAITEKELENLADGTYYFHAQFRNAKGWGAVAHFRFQVDTTAPDDFSIRFVDSEDTTNPAPTVLFDTTDGVSGIDYYKVKIGDGDFIVVSVDKVKSNPYTLPSDAPGKKQTILVQAFDRAGNYETALSDFTISFLPEPVITDYPEVVRPDEYFVIKGKTVALATVTVWLEKDGGDRKIYTGSSDAAGLFTIAGDGLLEAGGYKVWVEATDNRGAHTAPSKKYSIVVESSQLIKIGSFAINVLNITISIAALIVLLAGIVWFCWRKIFGFRRMVRRETLDALKKIHREFDRLRDETQETLRLLERAKTKRELTAEESKIVSQLRKNLDRAEIMIEKEVEDIKNDS